MVLFFRSDRADETHVGALIVDDNEDMRSLVRVLIDLDPDNDVVAEAADGCEAVRAWREHHPDAIVLDHHMPGATGLEVAEYILHQDPTTPIVLFSAYLDDATVATAERLGIRACVDKDQIARIPALLSLHRRRP